jgi:3-oxoacyl-[acyl-carrier protein] reductase
MSDIIRYFYIFNMSPQERLNLVVDHLRRDYKAPALLHGQVVIITGGAQGMTIYCPGRASSNEKRNMLTFIQGIGKAAANLLAKNGAKIVINDVDAVKADEAVKELKDSGHEAISIPGDLLNESFPKQLVEQAWRKWGSVNCLVNNAGQSLDSYLLWKAIILTSCLRQGFASIPPYTRWTKQNSISS